MQLTVTTFVSLDGVMQGPGGPEEDSSNGFDKGGWIVPFASEMSIIAIWFEQADAFLLGRSTFESMRGYWPQVTDPDNTVGTALNTLPKHVVSTTLTDNDTHWRNSTVIGDDILDTIRRLKQREGRELQVHGSWRLVRTLQHADLIDLYRLICFPVVVGSGKRLFGDGGQATSFAVEEAHTSPTGVTSMVLRPQPYSTGDLTVIDGKEAAV
jgi:dihydrofolate reductase